MAGSGAGLRLGVLVLLVAAVFGAAWGAGQLLGPIATAPDQEQAHEGLAPADGHGGTGQTSRTSHAGQGHGHGAGVVPGGLQVSEGGVTLEVLSTGLVAGQRTDFAFRIVGEDGRPRTGFTPAHDEPMHLVVVRRDLSGFQHLHPEMSPDGTWRVPLTFPAAGDHRVFADFLLDGDRESRTLGLDVPVAGPYAPVPLPPPALTTTVDDYRVTLSGELTAGHTSRLTLTVDRDGVPVTDLQPYLAAYGHLVALRQGDLAYLHVHPDGKNREGPRIVFHAEVPSAGTYRLYLDFKHDDVVRTAEFTAVADEHGH